MLIADRAAIAIEAKYTEPRYATVVEWLGPQPTGNRRAVLAGWLDAVGEVSGKPLSIEAVGDVPYQLIHRTASVCCLRRDLRAVMYQVFGETTPAHYAEDLRQLASLLAPSTAISFWVHACRPGPSAALEALASRWDNGERDLADDVRTALLSDTLPRVYSASFTQVTT